MDETTPPTVRITYPRPEVIGFVLCGEHDADNAANLLETLRTAVEQHDRVLVDVSEALFLDSTIIGALLRASRLAEARSGRLTLVMGTAAIVERALAVSGALAELEWASSVAEALDARPG